MDKIYAVNDILLVDDKEYCIIKKHNEYYVIVSLNKPLDIMVGKFKNDEFINENDLELIKKILCSK
ncbi:MAG: hypothetical protein E7158_04750 [Firmicutes bacterium]|nr:hypothetical protein [Bacillota bacterium]